MCLNENLLHGIGIPAQHSVVNSVGRKSKNQGIYVYIQLIHFSIQQKLTQHCEATILQYNLPVEGLIGDISGVTPKEQ